MYYEQDGKENVFELINYLLGHIKKDYIKNNDLNNYKILWILLLQCHWKHFDIKTREHDCGENEEDEDDVKDNENRRWLKTVQNKHTFLPKIRHTSVVLSIFLEEFHIILNIFKLFALIEEIVFILHVANSIYTIIHNVDII